MKSTDEIKKKLKASIVIENYEIHNRSAGGQHHNLCRYGVRAYCPELDIDIRLSLFRHTYKNRELAVTLVELAIDEAIK